MSTIDDLLRSESPDAVQAFLDGENSVFWIDWRELDDEIAGLCDRCLRATSPDAPALESELVEPEEGGEPELYHRFDGRREQVPLTYSPGDRYVTLVAIDQIIAPAFEIRLCRRTAGSDTPGFVVLASERWQALEQEFGEAVGRHFSALDPYENPFAEDPDAAVAPAARQAQAGVNTAPRAQKPWWAFWR